MDINEAAHTGAAEQRAADHTVARRRLLVAGATGTAFSLLPFLAGRAAASSDTTDGSTDGSSDVTTGGSTAETAAATTTTAPPKRPTEADIELLSFAQTIEITARDLYNVALAESVFADATLEAIKAIAEDHEAYGQAISGLIGRAAPNVPDVALFDELSPEFAGSAADVAAATRSLENNLVATHIEIVGQLVGIEASAMVASLVVVEARHATVLAHLAGVDTLDEQLTTDGVAIAASAAPAT